jgi:hypothetical protein
MPMNLALSLWKNKTPSLLMLCMATGMLVFFSLLLTYPQSGEAICFSALVILLLWPAVKLLIAFPSIRVGFMLSFVMILDDPAGNPFYGILPSTEILGNFIFTPIWRFTSIPYPLSLLESVLMLFAGYGLLRTFSERGIIERKMFSNDTGFSFILMSLWGLLICAWRKSDFGDALFQVRVLPLYFAAGVCGWCLVREKNALWNCFVAMSACSFVKSLQGLYIWFFSLGAGIVEKRYLIDHYYSDAFIGAICFIALTLLLHSNKRVSARLLWRIVVLLPICFALYLNNRRTAYIGGALSLTLVPFFLIDRQTLIRHANKLFIAISSFAFLLFLFLFNRMMGASGRANSADSSALYRINENLNLLELVRMHPASGAGFGVEMPLIHSMASVAHIYREFRLIPHNTLYFIWAFLGPLGLFWFASYCANGIQSAFKLGATENFGASDHQRKLKIMGFIVAAQVVRWLVYVFADMGLVETRFCVIVPFLVAGTARLVFEYRNVSQNI